MAVGAISLAVRGAAAESSVEPPIMHAVRGRVIDGRGQPIRGATVSLEGAPSSTITDAEGAYSITGVPPGAGLVVLADGYAAGIATASEHVDDVVLLVEARAETITVTSDAPPPVQGAGKLARADLERLPGAGNDAIRALQAMPGVVSFMLPLSDAGVAIRGSSPQDSKILIDDFEVPMLYHNIGFRSIVPAESIDKLDYIPGGFDVAFGRATSGIVQLTTRPGDDDARQQAELSSSDGGVLAQGSFRGGSYLLAFRRSVIDQLLPALLPDDLDLSLTTVPRYYDEQLRVDYAPSSRWALRLSSVGSDDVLELYTSKMTVADKRFYDRTRFVRLTASARYHDGPWTANLALSGIAQQTVFERGTVQHFSVTSPGVTTRAEVTRTLGEVGGLRDVTWRLGSEIAVTRHTIDLALPAGRREGETAGADDPMDTSQRFVGTIWTPDLASWTAIGGSLDPRVRVTAGLRFDDFERVHEFALQPRGEVAIKVRPTVTARLSAGAYRRPPEHQTELLYAGSGSGLGPALLPERAT